MRTRWLVPAVLASFVCPPALPAQVAQSASPADSGEAVIDWIRQRAVPLHHIEDGNGFSDLQPLKEIWKDVKVIGLGEATHGTREFFQVKHRLLEFLVTEMGFNIFAIEAAFSDSQPINDFVLHGVGDLATVLSGQGYVAWDTEEVAAMLIWMRDYNQRAPPERKVRFYGLDLFRNGVGRREVLAYLREYLPATVSVTDSIFRVQAVEEAKWPTWDNVAVQATLPHLQTLSTQVATIGNAAPGTPAAAATARALEYLRVMIQAATQIETSKRSGFLGENLVYLLERDGPDSKAVVWAHNGHVNRYEPGAPGGDVSMGAYVRRRYGAGYYGVGFEFGHGEYQYRIMPPPAELAVGSVPPAPAGSLPWYLGQSGHGDLFLDLRAPADHPAVLGWLQAPQKVHALGWGRDRAAPPLEAVQASCCNLGDLYDGILFIEVGTPVNPTANARSLTAAGKGF